MSGLDPEVLARQGLLDTADHLIILFVTLVICITLELMEDVTGLLK